MHCWIPLNLIPVTPFPPQSLSSLSLSIYLLLSLTLSSRFGCIRMRWLQQTPRVMHVAPLPWVGGVPRVVRISQHLERDPRSQPCAVGTWFLSLAQLLLMFLFPCQQHHYSLRHQQHTPEQSHTFG